MGYILQITTDKDLSGRNRQFKLKYTYAELLTYEQL